MILEQHTAAQFLALAALDLFPGVQLLEGKGTSSLFFYDFVFKEPLVKEQLPFLEERMRMLFKQRLKISMTEMMPGNASIFFKRQKQRFLAENIEEQEGALVSLVKIGTHLLPSHQECVKALDGWKVKLLESYSFEENGISVTRVIGVLFQGKEEIEGLKKVCFKKRNHLVLNQQEAWFFPLPQGFLFLPQGERVKQEILHFVRKSYQEKGFEEVSAPLQEKDPSYLSAHLPSLKEGKGVYQILYTRGKKKGEGLLGTPFYQTDLFHFFPLQEKFYVTCVSCLQFILEIPRILGFEFEIVLYTGRQKGAKEHFQVLRRALEEQKVRYSVEKNPELGQDACIVLYIRDGLGRMWEASWMRIVVSKGTKKDPILEGSLIGSLERLVGLKKELSF